MVCAVKSGAVSLMRSMPLFYLDSVRRESAKLHKVHFAPHDHDAEGHEPEGNVKEPRVGVEPFRRVARGVAPAHFEQCQEPRLVFGHQQRGHLNLQRLDGGLTETRFAEHLVQFREGVSIAAGGIA